MRNKHIAVLGVRLLAGLTIVVGLAGIVMSLAGSGGIPLLGLSVPGWVVGASVTYLGVRYWLRIPELEKTVGASAGFSWSNFKRAK